MMNMTTTARAQAGSYSTHNVVVEGGDLVVGRWGTSGPVVLAIHGITASHREFLALADALGEGVQLLAPDLRGRGGSRNIAGPWGMRAHAADMVAVLDHFDLPHADVVLGHSMGAFVAAVMGAEYPDRVKSLLMADGGLPIMPAIPLHRLPFGDWMIERLVQRVLGPALSRLDMTFESQAAYRDHWRDHPALRDDWSAYLEDYVDYDLVGTAPNLRPATQKTALLQDVRTQLFEDLVPASLRRLTCPVRFLRAPRGLMNDKALYPEKRVSKASQGIALFSAAEVSDTNHYTILIGSRGAGVVAEETRQLFECADH